MKTQTMLFGGISPYFQTAQFQSNILIHLISYMMHVVALDLDKHRQEYKNFQQFYKVT